MKTHEKIVLQTLALAAIEEIDKQHRYYEETDGSEAVGYDLFFKVRAKSAAGPEYNIACHPVGDKFELTLDKTFGQARSEVVNPGS